MLTAPDPIVSSENERSRGVDVTCTPKNDAVLR